MVIIAAVGGLQGVPLPRARLEGAARRAFAWVGAVSAGTSLGRLLARADPPDDEMPPDDMDSLEATPKPGDARPTRRAARSAQPPQAPSPAQPNQGQPADPAEPEATRRPQAALPDPSTVRSSVWPWPTLHKHPPPPPSAPEPPPPPPTVLVVHRRPEGSTAQSPSARGTRLAPDHLDEAMAPRALRNAIDGLLGNIVDKRDEDRGKGPT
jgi:hypothetical protein